jgi:hypothetical protein
MGSFDSGSLFLSIVANPCRVECIPSSSKIHKFEKLSWSSMLALPLRQRISGRHMFDEQHTGKV